MCFVKQRKGANLPSLFAYEQAFEPGFEDMPRRVPSLEKLGKLIVFQPGTPVVGTVDRGVAQF